MKRILAIGIILLFIGSISSSTGFNVIEQSNTTSNGKTLYVGGSGPGNYTKIQDAIDNASDGDTVYVYDDSSPYYENVVVNKSINLIGEDRDSTKIQGDGYENVINVTSDWTNITGFTVMSNQSYPRGINLGSNHNTVTGNNLSNNGVGIGLSTYSSNKTIIENRITYNNIRNNEYGIFLKLADNNTIKGNNITDNYYRKKGGGIYLFYSNNNNTIIGNNISNNGGGISLYGPNKYNILRSNIINNNTYNLGVEGWGIITSYYQDIDTSNTINGKPIYYLVEQSNFVLDDSMSIGYIGLVSCKNIVIKNLILTKNIPGLLIVNTSNSTINNVTLNNNYHNGISLYYSSNNIITNCSVNNNKYEGIKLDRSSNNAFKFNNITSNGEDGITLARDCNKNYILNNTISDNFHGIYTGGGIYNEKSNNNVIVGNNVISNRGNGIGLGSNNNTITNNNISNNLCKWYGAGIQLRLIFVEHITVQTRTRLVKTRRSTASDHTCLNMSEFR